MKRFGLIIGLVLFLTGNVFADVTAEVLSYKIDDNGNIEVHTQYKIDGVEVQSRYPQENGKYYWVTRYDAANFGSMGDADIKSFIQEDLKSNAEKFLINYFIKKENAKLIGQKFTDATISGLTATATEAKIQVNNDNDNLAEEEWTVKTSGEIIKESIVTP